MKETVIVSKEYKFYQLLLLFYPASYKKKFGQEMLILFEDIYHEKMQKDGRIGVIFWSTLIFDSLKGSLEQHTNLMHKQGMKKYIRTTLPINKYNIVGAILLLPFFALFMTDFIARILQGDLVHYNRPVYAYLSHTPLYWFPVLFSIAILFPALSVLLNSIPLIQNSLKKNRSTTRYAFVRQNAITLLLVLVGLGFLAIIKFHDFVPCMFHGLLKIGITQISHIIPVCRNA